MIKIKIRKLEKGTYEVETKEYDFHIRKENSLWAMDIFNSKIQDNNSAYIESFTFPTLKSAIRDAENYL